MSPGTETAIPAQQDRSFWIHGVDRTDPEFWAVLRKFWAKHIPTSPPWTGDPQKEQQDIYRHEALPLYVGYEVRPRQALVASATTIPTPPFKGASSETRRIIQVQADTGTMRDEWSENSTSPHERPAEIDRQIEALFEAAKEEIFEDGMETEFSKELVSLVNRYGNVAIEVMAHLIIHERVNAEVAAEALRWMGRIEHSPSYRYRLWLLARSLRCSSACIRDGAALGLSSMDDPNAIAHLEQAIQVEQIGELREDMAQVLAQLESTYRCRFS